MDKGLNILEMGMSIKECIKVVTLKVLDNIIGKMALYTKESLLKDWEKVKVYGKDLMVIFLKDLFSKIKKMERVFSNGQMVMYTKDNL